MKPSSLGAAVLLFGLAAPVLSDKGSQPRMSVWYGFSAENLTGESVGANPWPAYPLAARTGPGKFGKGLVLEGTGGNGLYLANPVSFFGAEAHSGTIGLWVRPAFAPAEDRGQRVLFDFMRDAGNTLIDGYEIVLFADGTKLKAKPSLLTQMEIESPLRKGEWTHLALAWDSEEGTSLYVNGEKKAERRGKFQPTELEKGWPGRIGCHTPGGGYPFAGTIDELRLFNYRLTDEEVRLLVNSEPKEPSVNVTGDWINSFTVTNNGREPVSLSLQVWQPGKHVAPPFLGYLPFPFGAAHPGTQYWVAGATPVQTLAEPVTLQPESEKEFRIARDADYFGRRRLRLMAGDGLVLREAAARDFGGLSIEPTRFRPLVYVAAQPLAFRASAANDLGRAFSGSVRAELRSLEGESLGASVQKLSLAQGQRREVVLNFNRKLPVGSYDLKLVAVEGQRPSLVNELSVHVTKDENYRTICDVAAAYTSPPEDPNVLQAMARDGVAALRQHGKYGDYSSSERIQSVLLRYGFKVTRMAIAGYSSCTQESRHQSLRQLARNLGLYLRDNPAVLNQVIAGEGLSAPPCYCDNCTRSFRSYLQQRWGALDELNKAWGSAHKDWSEIQQLGSPEDIDETAERLKVMKVALELPADNTARWRKLFELDRTRAIEWKRWHDQGLVYWYSDFAKAFRATNTGRTALCEQPCWPNFESHILFALGKIADLGGMDLYLPGEGPTTLGYAAELFLNFDMNASIFHAYSKPVMVHELYVQDNSPPLLPEAQGWWLIGRGYNLLTYFTYNYYYEGIRAGLPLIFGMFDKEGKPYPSYASFVRFSRELKKSHSLYNFNSMRREEPRVALFMGDDVSLANNLETGGATWEAAGVHGHNGAYWLTERSGFPVEFVNDDTFGRLAGKKALVVPWCHVLHAGTVDKMLAFARSGGTVIFDGAVALRDEAYRPCKPLPGGGLSAALGVSFKDYQDQPNRIVTTEGPALESQGVAVEPVVTKGTVLLKDTGGRPALVEIPVGRGKVLFFLTNLGRRNLSRVPDSNAVALWKSVLEKGAGLRSRCHLNPEQGAGAGPKRQNVFDVSVRIKDDKELFLFMVSFFEPTEGTLEIDLPPGTYAANDALTGEAVALANTNGKRAMGVNLPAFGSRVLRIKATSGKPFAAW